ncbi:MAG: TonB-dependent receptor [Paludibacter sp.]|nr:TonB-dependent receptor [Paludibacter sp.]
MIKLKLILLLFLLPVFAFGQQVSVKGKVTEDGNVPLPGVTVVQIGTANGTITDSKGDYSMNAENNGSILKFSFMGYESQQIKVEGNKIINVQMKPSLQQLDEVVVVGYGTQKKVNLTGAVSSVNSDVLENRQITNLGQGLQGLIPNLNISMPNGALNADASFNVRGITSINGGGPLILIDGVQMDPNQINPDDVESITVLKDAASAAIYGARAAFGVILITTKKGKKNTPVRVSYKGSYSVNSPTRLPRYLNSLDYVDMFREASAASGGTNQGAMFNDPDFYAQIKKYLANPIPANSVMPAKFGDSRKYWYTGNTDWYNEMYLPSALSKSNDISITGGEGKSSFYASVGFFDQGSLLRYANESYNRSNVSLGGSTEPTDWLTLTGSVKYNRKDLDQPNPIFLGNSWMGNDLKPTMPVQFPDGNYSGQGDYTNPIAVQMLNGRQIFYSNDLWITGGVKIAPPRIKGLSFNFDYTIQKYSENQTNHQKIIPEYGINGVYLDDFPHTNPNYYAESNYVNQYYSMNAYTEYVKTFSEKHYLKVLAGFNQEFNQQSGFSAQHNNLINNDFPSLNLATNASPAVSNGISEWALRGAFFRVNYIYNDKYLLEMNGRYDGSSRFPKSSRFGFFPSISGGWRISKESFMSSLSSVISDFKIRGSYGNLGNQVNGNNYPYIASLSTNNAVNYIMGSSQPVGIGWAGLVSSSLTWENVSTLDGGVDFTLFNKFSGTFDYYVRKTSGMLTSGQQLPAVLGASVPVENAADLRTNGWELTLTWKDRLQKDFKYEVSVVLSDNQSEITKFNNPTGSLGSYYVGQKLGEIWGYQTVGFLSDNGAMAANSDPASPIKDATSGTVSQKKIWGGNWMAGDIQYADLNRDGKIDNGQYTVSNHGDLKVIGNSTPRYNVGFRGALNWKDIDFDFLLQGIGKSDAVIGGSTFWGFTGEWNVPMIYQKDHWTPANTNAYYPRLRIDGSGNQQTQTKYLQNDAYLRLKNISLGYSIPKQFINKFKINKVHLYVSGQNILDYTKMFEAFDPEVLSNQQQTLQKSWVFGVQVAF